MNNENKKTIPEDIINTLRGGANYSVAEIVCGDKTMNVAIKNCVSLKDQCAFVNGVVEMIFLAGDDGNRAYCPAMKQFAFNYNLINTFTDIELPDDPELAYIFLTKYDIIQQVVPCINKETTEFICKAANEAIDFIKETQLRAVANSPMEALNGLIEIFMDKVNNFDAEELTNNIKGLIPELETILSKGNQG